MLMQQPLNVALVLALFGLVPVLVVLTTSFLKIAVVLMLLRNALGIQQAPPNIALYAITLILSMYIMAPTLMASMAIVQADQGSAASLGDLLRIFSDAAEPLRQFLVRNTAPHQTEFFWEMAQRKWPSGLAQSLTQEHFIVLIPAFVGSELIAAFQAGFLLYLPFVVIDLVVQAVLLSLGMMMSPMTISLPIKLLLFVLVDGWTKLVGAMILSYA